MLPNKCNLAKYCISGICFFTVDDLKSHKSYPIKSAFLRCAAIIVPRKCCSRQPVLQLLGEYTQVGAGVLMWYKLLKSQYWQWQPCSCLLSRIHLAGASFAPACLAGIIVSCGVLHPFLGRPGGWLPCLWSAEGDRSGVPLFKVPLENTP